MNKDEVKDLALMNRLHVRQMEIVNALYPHLDDDQKNLLAEFVELSGQLSDLHEKSVDKACEIIDRLAGTPPKNEKPKLKIVKKADG